MKIFKIVPLLAILTISQVMAQNNSSSLEQIQRDINALKLKMRTSVSREKSIREKIEDLNHDIGLRRRLALKLEREKTANLKTIRAAEASLASTIKEYDQRRDLISKRFVSMYKKGRQSDWESALSLSSVNQLMVWVKYQKVIIQHSH